MDGTCFTSFRRRSLFFTNIPLDVTLEDSKSASRVKLYVISEKKSKNYVWHILSLQSIFCVWIILIRLSGNGLICFPVENQMINLLLTALVFLINVSIEPPPSLKRETTRLTQTEPVPKYLQLLPLLFDLSVSEIMIYD